MKEYRITSTVNIFIFAENDEDVQNKLENMDYSFNDPDSGDDLQSELIDWEITDMGDIDEDWEITDMGDIDEEALKELEEVDWEKTMKRCAD